MRKLDKYVHSRLPYAIDPSSVTVERVDHPHGTWFNVQARAVWFRGRVGTPKVCLGRVWGSVRADEPPADPFGVLNDGRYGGDPFAVWDGHAYWGDGRPEKMQEYLPFLQKALEGFPAVPDGFDGWWTYR